jgi:uncharacterized protein YjcR
MGQQQIVAEQQAGGALRRIRLVVLVAALMALMMAATSAPAFAANGSFNTGAKNAIGNSDGKATGGLEKAVEHQKK